MNEIQFVEIDGEKNLKVIFDGEETTIVWYDFLSLACEKAYNGEFKDADVLLNVASRIYISMGDKAFNNLYAAVKTYVEWCKAQGRTKACLN